MTSEYTHKPVGGVARVVLHFADTLGGAIFSSEGCRATFTEAGIEVSLVDDSSAYVEQMSSEQGRLVVRHTLHLVAQRNDAEAWLAAPFAERATYEGVMAEVEMNDGRRVIVGCSAELYDEQPLRLSSLAVESGAALRDVPRVVLDLESHDRAFAAIIVNQEM